MSSLLEVDRELDAIAVRADHLAEVQRGVAAREKRGLAEIDAELAALGTPGIVVSTPRAAAPARAPSPAPSASVPRAPAAAPPPAPASAATASVEDEAPSGEIRVSDEVLRSSDLPAVLAIDAPADAPAPADALELDLASEAGLEGLDELPALQTSASAPPPAPPHVEPAAAPAELSPFDDPSAEFDALIGESDSLREDAVAAPAPDLEPEPTAMFTEADVDRFSRPPPSYEEPSDEDASEDVVLDIEEVIEIDEEGLVADGAAEPAPPAPRTAPPPPPRTGPPPPPGTRPSEIPPPRGFLGKLLQRKP